MKKTLRELSDYVRKSNLRTAGIPRGENREKRTENLLHITTDGNFPRLQLMRTFHDLAIPLPSTYPTI